MEDLVSNEPSPPEPPKMLVRTPLMMPLPDVVLEEPSCPSELADEERPDVAPVSPVFPPTWLVVVRVPLSAPSPPSEVEILVSTPLMIADDAVVVPDTPSLEALERTDENKPEVVAMIPLDEPGVVCVLPTAVSEPLPPSEAPPEVEMLVRTPLMIPEEAEVAELPSPEPLEAVNPEDVLAPGVPDAPELPDAEILVRTPLMIAEVVVVAPPDPPEAVGAMIVVVPLRTVVTSAVVVLPLKTPVPIAVATVTVTVVVPLMIVVTVTMKTGLPISISVPLG